MLFFVRSAMCALYPRAAGLPGLEDTEIDAFLVRFRRETTWLMWLGVLAATLVFHCTPVLTVWVPLPAFLIPQQLRDTHAHRLASTNFYLLRQSMMLLKLPAGLCWGAHPEVRRRFALAPYAPDPGSWRSS